MGISSRLGAAMLISGALLEQQRLCSPGKSETYKGTELTFAQAEAAGGAKTFRGKLKLLFGEGTESGQKHRRTQRFIEFPDRLPGLGDVLPVLDGGIVLAGVEE